MVADGADPFADFGAERSTPDSLSFAVVVPNCSYTASFRRIQYFFFDKKTSVAAKMANTADREWRGALALHLTPRSANGSAP